MPMVVVLGLIPRKAIPERRSTREKTMTVDKLKFLMTTTLMFAWGVILFWMTITPVYA
jgi:hypothetical protein